MDKKIRISKKEVKELLNVKDTKAKEVLNTMLGKGYILRKGQGRSTYYVLNKDI